MTLVEIHWLDSVGHATAGWRTPDALEDFDMKIETVGWLVQETEDAYVVSASRMCDGEGVYSPLKIPKVAVTGIWELEL